MKPGTVDLSIWCLGVCMSLIKDSCFSSRSTEQDCCRCYTRTQTWSLESWSCLMFVAAWLGLLLLMMESQPQGLPVVWYWLPPDAQMDRKPAQNVLGNLRPVLNLKWITSFSNLIEKFLPKFSRKIKEKMKMLNHSYLGENNNIIWGVRNKDLHSSSWK